MCVRSYLYNADGLPGQVEAGVEQKGEGKREGSVPTHECRRKARRMLTSAFRRLTFIRSDANRSTVRIPTTELN